MLGRNVLQLTRHDDNGATVRGVYAATLVPTACLSLVGGLWRADRRVSVVDVLLSFGKSRALFVLNLRYIEERFVYFLDHFVRGRRAGGDADVVVSVKPLLLQLAGTFDVVGLNSKFVTDEF